MAGCLADSGNCEDGKCQEQAPADVANHLLRHILPDEGTPEDGDESRRKVPRKRPDAHSNCAAACPSSEGNDSQHRPVPPLSGKDQGGNLKDGPPCLSGLPRRRDLVDSLRGVRELVAAVLGGEVPGVLEGPEPKVDEEGNGNDLRDGDARREDLGHLLADDPDADGDRGHRREGERSSHEREDPPDLHCAEGGHEEGLVPDL
mmetsp:Transcript_33866/g.80391  ORF Transcript_33866/g.80391 Transcript_33866/m.80391 type:complete len:203 (-) Transcript_33866:159-767(-)